MDFITATHTDVGMRKKVNQDSVFVEIADTNIGPVLLAAVCDGMGGLAEGEVASAKMVYALEHWFENVLSVALERGMLSFENFCSGCDLLIHDTGELIMGEAAESSGTTICLLFCAKGTYYTANVGDSRVYRIRDRIPFQLTKDQTVAQDAYERGKIKKEEIEHHPQRSVLLQCVGATDIVIPDYGRGQYDAGDVFLICSDGFRHRITEQEIADNLTFPSPPMESRLKDALERLTGWSMIRGEKDNISSAAIYITA